MQQRIPLGFSLIELLVVIAIITILGSLTLSVITPVRDMAHTAVCQGNLRQFACAFEAYIQDNECFPMPGSWQTTILPDSAAATAAGNTSRRCPSRAGRTDQFSSQAGKPAQFYGMNARLAPDQTGVSYQQLNAEMMKHPTAIKHPAQAAVILETRQSEQWGGPALIGFGYWRDRAEDLARHRGASNILFADWHLERRSRADIPRNRSTDAEWQFWTGTAAP